MRLAPTRWRPRQRFNTEAADVKSAEAELEHAKLDYDRTKLCMTRS